VLNQVLTNMNTSAPPPGSPDLPHLHAAAGLGASATVTTQVVDLPLPQGGALRGTWFEPPTPARAVALVAPATGVPQRFYGAFARWLAAEGYAVLTVDYRGLAQSRQAAPDRRPGASMRDWMQGDLPLALRHVLARAAQGPGPRLPTLWVGHSLGGHALTLQPQLGELDAVLCVGAQLPAFAHWPGWWGRWGAALFFKRWLPWVVGLCGHLPRWALGGGEALPAAAALDWSRWGQMPNYFASDPNLADAYVPERFRGVAHLYCVSDDWVFGPEPAVRALVDAFATAPGSASLLRISPQALGLRQLGHFAPFGRQVGERLWPLMLRRLEAATPALQARAMPAA
jgi:predicted alpha/beta hydrolase